MNQERQNLYNQLGFCPFLNSNCRGNCMMLRSKPSLDLETGKTTKTYYCGLGERKNE